MEKSFDMIVTESKQKLIDCINSILKQIGIVTTNMIMREIIKAIDIKEEEILRLERLNQDNKKQEKAEDNK